ncbi:MAG: hypothetical protein HOG49_32905 [Candidatus Scalindua sp.]|jgi:hypothetical protein|nr:hypothetical protein [Candidatus Scalindua sp.]
MGRVGKLVDNARDGLYITDSIIDEAPVGENPAITNCRSVSPEKENNYNRVERV